MNFSLMWHWIRCFGVGRLTSTFCHAPGRIELGTLSRFGKENETWARSSLMTDKLSVARSPAGPVAPLAVGGGVRRHLRRRHHSHLLVRSHHHPVSHSHPHRPGMSTGVKPETHFYSMIFRQIFE